MQRQEFENHVRRAIERVTANQRIEDAAIEAKSKYLAPEKVARRLAGHANAAGGNEVIWIIGLDEDAGEVFGLPENFDKANWLSSVRSQFEANMMPDLLCDLNIPVEDKTVSAYLFDTSNAPYVVRNADHGTRPGVPVEFEVPWRVGTSTRTATHANLIRMLVPKLRVPEVELLGASLERITQVVGGMQHIFLRIKCHVFFYPRGSDRLSIPLHKSSIDIRFPDGLRSVHPTEGMAQSMGLIESVPGALIINGPGRWLFDGDFSDFGRADLPSEVPFRISLAFSELDFAEVQHSGVLERVVGDAREVWSWAGKRQGF